MKFNNMTKNNIELFINDGKKYIVDFTNNESLIEKYLENNWKKEIQVISSWNKNNKGGGVSISIKNTIHSFKGLGIDVSLPMYNDVTNWSNLDERVKANEKIKVNKSIPCLCIDFDGYNIKGISKGGDNLKITHIRTNFIDIEKYEQGETKEQCKKMSKYLIENIKNSDAVICSSQYAYDNIIEFVPYNTKAFIIPNGIDYELGIELDKINNIYKENRIISIGSLLYRKGNHHLIQACKYLKDIGIDNKLIIVGEGTCKEQLMCMAKGYSNIRFKRYVEDRGEIARLMKSAQIICHPSIQEDFGNVYIEAGRARRPIIATNSGAASELVNDNDNGFLFEKDNWISLAEKLRILLKDKNKCNKFGENGYKNSIHYTWEKYCISVMEAFRIVEENI